jgi:acyl-CoA reductase-like NAD-dependent aldehyde dehydrogenase
MSKMKARVDAMRMGPTELMETDVGPLISKEQLDRVESYITIGANEGARTLCGGPVNNPVLKRGYYVKPTVFTEVKPEMRIATIC